MGDRGARSGGTLTRVSLIDGATVPVMTGSMVPSIW
jgi:hypothetical protein